MDQDRVKGAVNDTTGRIKRQVGEWTGDTGAQVEGAVQQAKGKAQKAWGTVKDAARNAKTDAEREHEKRREQETAKKEEERENAHSGHGRP